MTRLQRRRCVQCGRVFMTTGSSRCSKECSSKIKVPLPDRPLRPEQLELMLNLMVANEVARPWEKKKSVDIAKTVRMMRR